MKEIIKIALRSTVKPRYGLNMASFFKKRYLANKYRRESYIKWFEKSKLSEDAIKDQRKLAKELPSRPLISVLVPTYNTNPEHLRMCLDSVISQTYDNWEICISDDASTHEETKEVIREYVDHYNNITARFGKTNGHIAVSSNVALGMAKGDYISLLDHDDLLAPDALYETVKVINDSPNVDLIYTDEDKIDVDGVHIEPFFKPDWSPDFLNSCNMITHFATMREDVIRGVGGFTPGTQGAQDWDLFLRITKNTDKVHHIPRILYYWRKSETSTAMSAKSKPYAYINQGRVLRDSVMDRNENAYIKAHPALGFWRKQYVIDGHPLISIVIPTKNCLDLVTQCVGSIIEKSTYPYFEIILVDSGSDDDRVYEYYDKITANYSNIKIVDYKNKKFNFSKACNLGAKNASGEYLLFLNNDTEVISNNWIQSMLEFAQRDNVGVVGGKLLFPDDTIQHAGVVLSERDIAFHPFYGTNPIVDIFTYIYSANIRNVSAVTGACMMVSRSKFDGVGGFDEELRITYNDVDFSLKMIKAGYLNVYTPYTELYHHESVSVGKMESDKRDDSEYREARQLMSERWSDFLVRDPYYNDNFEPFGPGYRLPPQ